MMTKIYNAEPTLALFHAANDFVRGIRGPIGSGKSVGCCMEILSRAARQQANSQGIRKSRWCVVRNTYGELKSTTIKTWQDWVPNEVCPIVYDSPIRGRLLQKQPDGTTIELEMLFLALDRPDHIKKLLSLELTGAWINEAREVPKAILDGLTGRVGRYPNISDAGATWSGIIMDTNPPDDDHWWYNLAEEETPKGWKFFAQPPALLYSKERGYYPNPEAENVENHKLGYEYWLRQVPGKSKEWIKAYILGLYSNIQDGKPVYPEYNDDIHCASYLLQPVQNLPIILGFDFGLTPACIFGQVTPRGRLLIFDELVSESMGIKQFLRDCVKPHIKQFYQEFENYIFVVGDPAGNQRAQTDETTCLEEVERAGFAEVEPASTNSFLTRREAVAAYLTRLSDGKPCFLVSPKCKMLRRGFLGGYRYQKVIVSGSERFKELPEKNKFSHPHDGLQYLALRSTMGAVTMDDINNSRDQEADVRPAGQM
jgi:hypothetical protein